MPTTLPFSLDALRSHSIFVPPPSTSDDAWEFVQESDTHGLPVPKNARVALRDKDLILAFGKEIRMTSLGGEGWEVHNGRVGAYKTLKSPHLTFPIHQLLVNPTGRLLAVVGHHQLVILILPRSGFSSSSAGEIACRSFPVDEYQHSPSSTNAITKVMWHEWGEAGNSLWALTGNGKLFEYNVLKPQDPVQTFNFLPQKANTKASKFSALDPLAQYATSFAFSNGTMDFGPLMVYVLMANGDVYTMGPVMPLHAMIPAVYLQSLRAWMSERSNRLREDEGAAEDSSAQHAALLGRVTLQTQWVESLAKQNSPDTTPTTRRGYGLRPQGPEELSKPPPGMLRVHPPHLTESGGPAPGLQRPLLRQGPLLFNPSAQEVGNGDELEEQFACDIMILDAKGGKANSELGEESESLDSEGINVMVIAWSGGRVDLGTAFDTPELRWVTSRDPSPEDLVVPTVESVLVTFPANLDTEAIESNAPTLVSDPIHPDVVYVQNNFGVDAISVAPWVSKLLADDQGDAELPPSDVACLVGASATVPIVGSVTFCNITFGYGLAALASSGQLATVEMDLRVRDSGSSTTEEDAPVDDSDSQSLLSGKFDVATLLANITKADYNPRSTVRKAPDSAVPLTTITPDHLRTLADVGAQIRQRAEAVRGASATVERRADLDIAEYKRQVKVLADAASRVTDVQSQEEKSATRVSAMRDQQAALAKRLDAVLHAMLREFRPQIGEVEQRWFDELERIRQRVGGGGAVRRSQALQQQAAVLREQLRVVKPAVEARINKDKEAASNGAATAAGTESAVYGARQLRPIHSALGSTSSELERIMRKIDGLSIKVQTAGEDSDDE